MKTLQFNFRAISISYKSAPVGVREGIALNDVHIKNLLHYFKEFSDLTEALILSTCNRTEVYYHASENKAEEIIKLIGIEKGLNGTDSFLPFFEVIDNQENAMKHLFDVSMGLDAQVVGDIQISNQVKRAYQMSADANLAGPFLHRLMHTIFFTNKRVIQETSFRDGAASVSYATAEMVKEVAAEFIAPKILVLGLGEIGADVCRNLADSTLTDISVANRTEEKAISLSAECGFDHILLSDALNNLSDFDIIISSIGARQPILTFEMIENFNIAGHKYFFDLSVPRSIEEKIDTIVGAIVYNIDDINAKTSAALNKRIASIPQVNQIVNEALEGFTEWSNEMAVSPTINKLKSALEEIRQAEIARALKGVSEADTAIIDKVTKNMMQKIIKLPVLQLKAACKRGEAETLIDVLNDLFNLESKKVGK